MVATNTLLNVDIKTGTKYDIKFAYNYETTGSIFIYEVEENGTAHNIGSIKNNETKRFTASYDVKGIALYATEEIIPIGTDFSLSVFVLEESNDSLQKSIKESNDSLQKLIKESNDSLDINNQSINRMILATLKPGFIGSNGNINLPASLIHKYTENYIKINLGRTYTFKIKKPITQGESNWCAFATYDNNRNFISRTEITTTSKEESGYVITTGDFIINNSNVAFIRLSFVPGSSNDFDVKLLVNPFGDTYATKEQVKDISTMLINNEINISEDYLFEKGYFLGGQGVKQGGSKFSRYGTELIPVNPKETLTYYGKTTTTQDGESFQDWWGYGRYNKSGEFIAREAWYGGSEIIDNYYVRNTKITIPQDTYFIRLTYTSGDNE